MGGGQVGGRQRRWGSVEEGGEGRGEAEVGGGRVRGRRSRKRRQVKDG